MTGGSRVLIRGDIEHIWIFRNHAHTCENINIPTIIFHRCTFSLYQKNKIKKKALFLHLLPHFPTFPSLQFQFRESVMVMTFWSILIKRLLIHLGTRSSLPGCIFIRNTVCLCDLLHSSSIVSGCINFVNFIKYFIYCTHHEHNWTIYICPSFSSFSFAMYSTSNIAIYGFMWRLNGSLTWTFACMHCRRGKLLMKFQVNQQIH
jgi:hypothetical protein